MRPGLIAVVLLLSAPVEARAQYIAGKVTDATSHQSVGGVVVTALDAKGATVTRAITDFASGYRIVVTPAVVRLQFRRIGYSAASANARDTVSGRIDVVMRRLPIQLPPITSTGDAPCEPRPDRVDALTLWDQVRAGLLASIVARETRPAQFSALTYHFDLGANDNSLAQFVTRQLVDSATKAFSTAPPPAQLVAKGYMEKKDGGRLYIGPDESVLLDDTFLDTHCFALVTAGAPSDSIIGLWFQPAKGREKLVDVQGTVWLTRDPLDLRSVEYQYSGVERAVTDRHGGGSLTFLRLPNGLLMMSNFRVRAVVPRGRNQVVAESGATIEWISWTAGDIWMADLRNVSGRLLERGTLEPASGFAVSLLNAPYDTYTDSTGDFEFTKVLPGTYAMDMTDTLMARYGVKRGAAVMVEIPNQSILLPPVGIESLADAKARVCNKSVRSAVQMPGKPGPWVVLGRLVSENGTAGFGQVHGTFRDSASNERDSSEFTIKTTTDGFFQLCGVRPGAIHLALVTRDTTVSAAADMTLSGPRQLHTVTLTVRPGSGHR